jgi:hypothetical protein
MSGVCTPGPHTSPQPWVMSALILAAHVALALISAYWLRNDEGALLALGQSLAARVAHLWALPLPAPALHLPPARVRTGRRATAYTPRVLAADVCFPVGRRGPPAVCAAL